MYRKRRGGSRKFNERMARARAAKAAIRLAGPAPEYAPELPPLRRRVIVEDYDLGQAVRHEVAMYRSSRIDCYTLEVDGQQLPGRFGWAKTLELVRKAFIRVGAFT